MANYLLENNKFLPDTIKGEYCYYIPKTSCIWSIDKNRSDTIAAFMKKYDLDKICFEKSDDNYFNHVIIFHKSYNPLFGRSRTIDYDFGTSPLRDKVSAGMTREGTYTYKIIDSVLVYTENKSPAFGE